MEKLKSWFNSVSLQVKAIFAFVIFVIGGIFYFIVSGKIRAIEKEEFSEQKKKKELEIAKTELKIEAERQKLLKEKKETIKIDKNLKALKEEEKKIKESAKDDSMEELKDFFNKEGL